MAALHQAGLPTIDATLTWDEAWRGTRWSTRWPPQAPYWEPGTAHGYHAVTYGHLVGEVVRRIDGRSLGTFFRDEFAEPLGLDFWIGLPEELEPRVAPIIPMESVEGMSLAELVGPDALIVRALSLNGALPDLAVSANTRGFHAAEIPAANGVTNARSLARLYAALIGEVEDGPSEALLTPEQINYGRTRQTSGPDRVLSFPGLDIESTIGLGFWTASPFAPMGGAGSFGHYGAGGSLGFADPENGLAAGYVMNQMGVSIAGDPRSSALIRASYESAGAPIAFV